MYACVGEEERVKEREKEREREQAKEERVSEKSINATMLHATYRSPVFETSYSTNLDHCSCTEREFMK